MPDPDDPARDFTAWQSDREPRTQDGRISRLEAQMHAMQELVRNQGVMLNTVDTKLDTVLSRQDQQIGRAEMFGKLFGSVPGALWTLTLGGAVAALGWAWHTISAYPPSH